jgi:hypothetical protein
MASSRNRAWPSLAVSRMTFVNVGKLAVFLARISPQLNPDGALMLFLGKLSCDHMFQECDMKF